MKNIPTVKVQNGDGFMTINESAFDPKRHKKWVGYVPPVEKPATSYKSLVDELAKPKASKDEKPKRKYQRRRKMA